MANEVVERQESVTTELWKDIKDYEGLYQISNTGRVKRIKFAHKDIHGVITWILKEKILKPKYDGKGYAFVTLGNGTAVRKNIKIARLVANAFISEPPFENAQVDHIDRDKKNNSVTNLRWVTNTENCRNTRKNILFTVDKETKTLAEWCELYKTPYSRVQRRIYMGWNIKDALTTPVKGKKDEREAC